MKSTELELKVLRELKDAWVGELERAKKPTAREFAAACVAGYEAKITALNAKIEAQIARLLADQQKYLANPRKASR